MAKHAILAPSSSHRYLECAASAYYNQAFREHKENVPADQGTVAHHISYLWFTSVIDDVESMLGKKFVVIDGDVQYYEDFPEHKGTVHIVDHQMVDGINAYTRSVTESYDLLDKETRGIGFELRVPIDHVTKEPNASGTSDVVMFDKNRIEVHDLKYGYVEVMSTDNPQLKIYGLGAIRFIQDKYPITFAEDAIVRSVIHQPRVKDAPDVYDYKYGDLLKWCFANTDAFLRALAVYQQPEILTKSDFHHKAGSHCQYCVNAERGCKYFMAHLGRTADEAAIVLKEPPIINDKAMTLVKFYELSAAIKTLSQRVEEELIRRIVSGEEIPGYRLGKGREGNRKWTISDQDELKRALLERGLTEEMVDVVSVISPALMSARVKAGDINKARAKEIENELITRTPASVILVKENSSKGLLTPEEIKELKYGSDSGIEKIDSFEV